MRPHQPSLGGVEGIAKCIDAVLEAKRTANRTPRYVRSLEYYLRQFAAGREDRPLADFTFEDVEGWMKRYPSFYTRQTWLNRLSTLFAFAVRRDFIQRNPCDRLERIKVDRCAPLILSPAQSQQLLALAPMVCRPYVILGMFAGIRPEELLRLKWADVDLETRTVTVNDAKTRRRRIVPLHDKAVKLLGECPLRTGPVAPSNSTVRRFKRVARQALGLPSWPSDLLRHTAASYLLALHGDAGKVATMLGNSSSILLSHYHQPVRNGDCGHFWELEGRATVV